ncbi:hypothetical protein N658DRAFT_485842 [Parathielavia hyrcaniae]|uniref:Uncharacterized protein n=1 Tax=Parathielavia hyrcaniae TaxID=113614 RepID=A0AAN6Q1R0_9PEZI|nr:hypothetical protein N658DRAFT_485842 [Parathielavia hyrcaniae]
MDRHTWQPASTTCGHCGRIRKPTRIFDPSDPLRTVCLPEEAAATERRAHTALNLAALHARADVRERRRLRSRSRRGPRAGVRAPPPSPAPKSPSPAPEVKREPKVEPPSLTPKVKRESEVKEEPTEEHDIFAGIPFHPRCGELSVEEMKRVDERTSLDEVWGHWEWD